MTAHLILSGLNGLSSFNVAATEVTSINNKERKVMKLIMITIMSLQKKKSYMPKNLLIEIILRMMLQLMTRRLKEQKQNNDENNLEETLSLIHI